MCLGSKGARVGETEEMRVGRERDRQQGFLLPIYQLLCFVVRAWTSVFFVAHRPTELTWLLLLVHVGTKCRSPPAWKHLTMRRYL